MEVVGFLSIILCRFSWKSEYFFNPAHVTQTRHAHQVILSAFYMLLIESFDISADLPETGNMSFNF